MISVIIPTYNRESTIVASAQSVLEQSYEDIELIIVDDGSTDKTIKKLEELKDNRVTIIKGAHSGACAARNIGIAAAKGEYIAFQDSDDIWEKTKLEMQLAQLKKDNADIVFCALRKNGMIHPILHEGIIDRKELIITSKASTQTIMAKNYVFKEHKFDEKMPRLQDFDWIIRASRDYKVCFVPSCLVNTYVQSDSLTNSYEKLELAVKMIMEKYKDDPDADNKIKSEWIEIIAKEKAKRKNVDCELFWLEYTMYKSPKKYLKYLCARMGLLKLIYKIKDHLHIA